MHLYRAFQKGWKRILNFIKNSLVPEDRRVAGLLRLDAGTLRELLPHSPVNVPDLFVLFDYQNRIVRLIVKSIKYKNNQSLRGRVAEYLREEIVDLSAEVSLFDGREPLLLPMPMSKKEKSKKGFNQCEELVREIQKSGGVAQVSYNALKKIRETERQTTLSRDARLRNVHRSMWAEESQVKDRVVLVLDDVYTTLASFSEAKRALLAAGAKKVIGLFIAH